MKIFYILEGHKPVPCEDPIAWCLAHIDPEAWRVALTTVGAFNVSTVFLGINNSWLGQGRPPILFETMVSGPDGWTNIQRRYATWEEAERGHERVCGFVRDNYASLAAERTD